jgi:hypothetical protein
MTTGLLDRGLSKRTAQYAHRVLAMALQAAEGQKAIGRNPAASVKAPRPPRAPQTTLSAAEARKLLAAAQGGSPRRAVDPGPHHRDASAISRFEAFVSFHAEFHARRSQAAQIVNGNLPSLSGQHYRRAITLRARYEHAFRDLLAIGAKEGVFHIEDLRVTSFAILEMGMGISVWYKPDGDLSVRALADRHVSLALRMVGAPDRS